MDGYQHFINKWDLIIAHPPCTRLCNSGSRWWKKYKEEQEAAISFFMQITVAQVDKLAIENPVGIMSTIYRKPDQIIQPYYFGDPYTKTTCLWLKGLPPLLPTNIVSPGEFKRYGGKKSCKMPLWYTKAKNKKNYSEIRSKTFLGIAKAMAEQWG